MTKTITIPSTKPSVYNKAHKLPSSPAKPTAPIHPRKENNATPFSRKPATESSDKKRSTPLSAHLSINTTPAREPRKLSNPVVRKIETSRVGANFSKPSKDCPTPLRTPTRVNLISLPWSLLTMLACFNIRWTRLSFSNSRHLLMGHQSNLQQRLHQKIEGTWGIFANLLR